MLGEIPGGEVFETPGDAIEAVGAVVGVDDGTVDGTVDGEADGTVDGDVDGGGANVGAGVGDKEEPEDAPGATVGEGFVVADGAVQPGDDDAPDAAGV